MGIMVNITYNEMKTYTDSTPGMKMIKGDVENKRAMIADDVVYAVKDGVELHLRLIYPRTVHSEDVVEKYPVLVHIQGSAWYPQFMNDHVMDFKGFAEAGFVVAIVQYRDSFTAKIPGQICDAKDAVRYIALHAEELNIDSEHIFLSGDSSGGHTSAMCWASWPVSGQLDENTEEKTALPEVKAFLDFYGPSDFFTLIKEYSPMNHLEEGGPESLALGCYINDPDQEERVRECNVLTYVVPEVKNAPLCIFHGNKDRLIPLQQSVILYETAKAAGKDVEFYCVDGADHGGAAFYCKAFFDVLIPYMKSFL